MDFKQKQWLAVFLGILFIEIALFYKLLSSHTEASSTELITAICIIGIFLVLISKGDSLKLISLGKDGFRAELEVLQKMTNENERAIVDLVHLLPMGEDAFKNLEKIATGKFGQYIKEAHMGLETELYHLRNLGYVELNKDKARSIHEIPPSGEELSEYIKITETGKKYIELRNKHEDKS